MNDFAIGDLFPKQQTLSRFASVGQATILLTNRGQAEARFRLEAADAAGLCRFEFEVPGESTRLAEQAEFWLQPGETVTLPLTLIPPTAPFIALLKPTHHYTVTVTKLNGTDSSRSVLGQLSTAPLIGPWLFSLTAACLMALVIYAVQLVWISPPESYWPDRRQATSSARSFAAAPPAIEEILPATAETIGPSRTEMSLEEIFKEIGPQYDLDWRLLAEIAYQESRMDPLAIGRDSDLGLMQIIPSTWTEWAPKVGVTDPFDPYSNVLVAAAYLAYVRDYADRRGYQEEYWMLIGYNWGPNNLRYVFDNNGDWSAVPAKRRQYAIDILNARNIGAERWQTALTLSEAE